MGRTSLASSTRAPLIAHVRERSALIEGQRAAAVASGRGASRRIRARILAGRRTSRVTAMLWETQSAMTKSVTHPADNAAAAAR
jgi:hypothetical protein